MGFFEVQFEFYRNKSSYWYAKDSFVYRQMRSEEFIKLKFIELFSSVKVSKSSKSGVLQQA